jgi:hypothetical protein
MESCLSAVSDWKHRLEIMGAAFNEVHRGEEQIKELLPQVKGMARTFKEGKAAAMIDHMKTYAFPTQDHIEQLREAGELAVVDAPSALKSEPCTLFEIKLQPRALRNGSEPQPMWVHIHTRKEVHAHELHTLADTDFAKCHVKSHAERGRNREWQRARAKEGHDNVMIYRGKLPTAMCRSLMAAG